MWKIWCWLKIWSTAPSLLGKELEDGACWIELQNDERIATQQTIIRIIEADIKNKQLKNTEEEWK